MADRRRCVLSAWPQRKTRQAPQRAIWHDRISGGSMPQVAACTVAPVAPLTRLGPPRPMKLVRSTIRMTSERAGK